MSDTETTEQPTGEQTPPTEAPEAPQGDEGTDWVAEARKWEKRAKENSDAAARLKELEDAQKSEQDKLTERLTAAEKRAADNELKALRLEVAAEKGLTKAQAKYLTGTTEDELSEAADELLELFADQARPTVPSRPSGPGKGNTPSDASETRSASDMADAVIKRQRGY